MKRFRFRLERILHFKEQVEKQRKLILSDRNEDLRRENNHLSTLTTKREEYSKKYGRLFKGRIDIDNLKIALRFLNKIKGDVRLQTRKVNNAQKKVENAKVDLRDSMRDRKKFANLQDRKRKEYDFEANREDRKELDEFASQTRLMGRSQAETRSKM
jgi:flagellar FliJ protein